MRVVVDGRLVAVPAGTTVGALKRAAGLPDEDRLVAVQGSRAEPQRDSAPVREGARLRSIPAIEQGGTREG